MGEITYPTFWVPTPSPTSLKAASVPTRCYALPSLEGLL